jgi:hypothetical protein
MGKYLVPDGNMGRGLTGLARIYSMFDTLDEGTVTVL